MSKINLAAALLLLFILAVPATSSAKVFWTETFENHLYPNWIGSCISQANPDGTCSYPQISSSFAHSGTHSGFEHYADMHVQAGTFIDRYFPVSDNVWMRWYQYTSNFDYGDGSVVVKNFIISG